MSRIRGMRRYTPMESETTLSPRVMMIPDDPLCSISNDGQSSWSSDTNRLLKLVDDQSLEALENLLSLGASVNGHGGAFHETLLHKAAQQGWAAGLQLFLSYGASPHSMNQFGQTPLHYASASKSCDCLKKLLEAGCQATLDHRDMRGHTPLHDAASAGFPQGVSLLLQAGANTESKDKNEETPLHKAAKARCVSSMLALLNKGADMGARDKSGESVLSYVLRHIPTGMEDLLDHCLVTNADKLSLKKLEVEFNFVPLAGSSELNQMKILNNVVELRHPKLLLHPVCEAFLLLKWHNVRKLFFIEVIFYFTHAILATLLILDKFVWQIVDGAIPEAIPLKAFEVLEIILLLQAVLILVKQVFTIIQGVRAWIFSLWHVLNGVIPVLVLLVVPGTRTFWQHHIATITLLLIWVQCMLHIGRFPGCGIYVAMFTRVAKVFVRIFLIFFCLLLAFSLSFYVGKYGGTYYESSKNTSENATDSGIAPVKKFYVNDKVYSNPIMTFIKTLTMMIGELDFDSNFVEQLGNLPGTSHVIYLAFVILVSIILSNLLVALAVNDVQGLRNSAHLERLIKQVELVFQMEKTFSTFASFASTLNFSWLRVKVMLFVHDFGHTKVFVQPYHPQKGTKLIVFERGFMKEINLRQNHVKNVMDCLRIREEQNAERKDSVKRIKSRPIRSDYSAFSGVEEGLAESLKRVEGNILESLNERIDEIVLSLSTLSAKFKVLEDKFAKGLPGLDGDQVRNSMDPLNQQERQQMNHVTHNPSFNRVRLSQDVGQRTRSSMHQPQDKRRVLGAQSFHQHNRPPLQQGPTQPIELQKSLPPSSPNKSDVKVQFEMVVQTSEDPNNDKKSEFIT